MCAILTISQILLLCGSRYSIRINLYFTSRFCSYTVQFLYAVRT